jgi:hypothetical protein
LPAAYDTMVALLFAAAAHVAAAADAAAATLRLRVSCFAGGLIIIMGRGESATAGQQTWSDQRVMWICDAR